MFECMHLLNGLHHGCVWVFGIYCDDMSHVVCVCCIGGKGEGVIVLEREVDGTCHWLNGCAHHWRDHHMDTIYVVWM